MKTVNDVFESAINHWNKNIGVGSALIPAPLNDVDMIVAILERMYAKNPNNSILVIVKDFKARAEFIEYLTHQEDEENNNEFKDILNKKYLKVLTESFIERNDNNYHQILTIVYRPTTLPDYIIKQLNNARFKLVVMNKLFTNSEDTVKLHKICPLLDDFKQSEIDELRTNRPVEEIMVGVDIPSDTEDAALLKYYDEYIATTLNIFGTFDVIQQARIGNAALNISSIRICSQIAADNGWNEHLDMSIEYNREIDALYNPNSLRDRANKVYEVIRNRSQLLSDYSEKLKVIKDIVDKYPEDNFLIINKRGEFASMVTSYLNNLSDHDICGDFHDKVDNVPATDDYGNPIFVKSGKCKGQRRMYGSKMQKSVNNRRIVLGNLRCLSTNNAPDKDLFGTFHHIIISSTQCENVESYLYRLSKISFDRRKILVHTLYCKGTSEENAIKDREVSPTHNIIYEKENVSIDENNFGFMLVD